MTSPDRDLRDLRLLDPAGAEQPEAGREPRAQAMLADILTKPRQPAATASGRGSTPHRVPATRGRRWVLVAAAAAAVAVGLVALPRLDATDHAFASWTPVPAEVSTAEHTGIREKCWPGGARPAAGERTITIAEERGRVTFLAQADAGRVHHCLLIDGEFHSTGFSGNGLPAEELRQDDAAALMATSGGTGSAAHTAITGVVGENVLAVEVHPRVADADESPVQSLPEVVEASIESGYYAAWWPGELTNVELTLTIRLADGSVIADVPAFAHDR